MSMFGLALVSGLFLSPVLGLENGLARTPPMGWLSWAKFYCEVDCGRHPLSCINARLYMDMADRLAEDGYLEAGYDRVNVDDCWMAYQRDSHGRLRANATRFPQGIPGLAKYVHSKGLKLGIYEDFGTKTCGGYPGSLGHLQTDAETFAAWTVDMLKLDGCYANSSEMSQGYPQMEVYLNATHRGLVYSCSWPAYLTEAGKKAAYPRIVEYCNLWRNYNDISKSWASIASIIKYYVANQDILIPIHGPGHWNDPDMILVGNNEISVDQSEAQMAVWSMWSAPLLMSNDLRWIAPAYRSILLNKKVIAVDQDPLGVMARAISNSSNVLTFVKPMTPYVKGRYYSYAVAFLNMNLNRAANVTARLNRLGLNYPGGYMVEDLFKGTQHGLLKPDDLFRCSVNPTGVCLIKATLASKVPPIIIDLL